MLFLLVNVVFALIGGAFVVVNGTVPAAIAWICVILGGLTLGSRILAWTTGAASAAYAMAENHEDIEFGRGWRNRMIVMELAVWAVSLANVSYFFGFYK